MDEQDAIATCLLTKKLDSEIPGERSLLLRVFLIPQWEQVIIVSMRILSRSTLKDFWEVHPDAEEALKTWYYEASHTNWKSPSDIKAAHRNASIIASNRVVFNIKGNTYRTHLRSL